MILGGATPTDKGVWLPGRRRRSNTLSDEIPFQPWAKALFDDRQKNELEPHTRCKPSGATRQFLTPYGVEFVDLPEMQRVYIFDIGGPHTFRTVYMDGRSTRRTSRPPITATRSAGGKATRCVVDTIGYNEGFWMDRAACRTPSKLHTLEKFTRTDR